MSKKILLIMVIGISVFLITYANAVTSDKPKASTGSQCKWQLGMQAYSFNRFSFYEAIDKTASLGMGWIEAYPGQILNKSKPDVKVMDDMPAELRIEIKKKLKEANVKLIAYGVVQLKNDEAACRKIFNFAKEMGVEIITAEPEPNALEMVDKLCNEYGIKVAIHNHPKPSMYWNPDKILEACKGRSKMIGSCADTGHWMRSGVNPLEAVKKLEGRIVSFHLKDLNEFGNPEAHDVPWGSGKADIRGILEELARQKFSGFFAAEYEYNWENSVPELKQCAEFFNKAASELNENGWKELFSKDLSNCILKQGSWAFEPNGVLARMGGGDIWTKERYGDFVLDLEFKVSKGANSGVFLRCYDLKNWINTAIEVQIHDTEDGTKHGQCGAIYDCLSPSKNVVKPTGEWNHYNITCKANKISIVLNGEQIIDMDLDKWTEAGKNPDGTPNKFKIAYKDMAREGHIGLQDHGSPIWFRNVRIKELN